ncbi:dTDP-4-amino-4,6-dideoxygalactose transaminase [uncultured Tenacibaculum sp.]|uniref:dTDP-4-amino-4,6-dideoxygalactose transaminase n=1 Tax=uncultured Tenacibaculum sp. TaxID=174713 RepID=UPI002632841A|nr:dTDP-4-amino-4,6-dideoxygalactose transaminase [uncultured Tenacibaculum sp.]
MIPFNKPFLIGNELEYIKESVSSGKISGNGNFTKKCQSYFELNLGVKKTLLTTSCTDALEMSAMLVDIKPGDEVIVPSYTFVSSALAFVRQGAKIVFADSRIDHPGIDEDLLEDLITPRTKAVVVVHYAGVACDMDKIMELSKRYNFYVIEDAAQAIDSYYKGKPLGTIGHLGTFSFHETKNIICGEGGLLTINDDRFVDRAEILWEKGTNRSAFFKGEVNKYGWVDTGSSFLPSELIAAFLFAQLENLKMIQKKRKEIWQAYFEGLKELEENKNLKLGIIPEYATNNAHMFYVITKNQLERDELISFLKNKGIHSVFHYLCLHKSEYYKKISEPKELVNAQKYDQCLLRLPFFYELSNEEVKFITNSIKTFYGE